MKIKVHPFVKSASGAMGDMVFYELDGQPVSCRKAVYEDNLTAARNRPPPAG